MSRDHEQIAPKQSSMPDVHHQQISENRISPSMGMLDDDLQRTQSLQ